MVIFTLGITPPVASVTVPVIELRAWPRRLAGEVKQATQTAKHAANRRQLAALGRCNSESAENILMLQLLVETSEANHFYCSALPLAFFVALSGEKFLKFS